MSSKHARQAWNEAMASAGQRIPGTSISRRSSSRAKKHSRRDRARKSTTAGDDGDGVDAELYRAATRIDALEDVVDDPDNDEDEEEYDELEEVEGGGGAKRKRKRRGGGGGGGASKKKRGAQAGAIPKRLKARSLASILLEEAGRSDGVVKQYLGAESKPPPPRRRPRRKFCPVSGLVGCYNEPKSGIPYANLQALEQIRERAPPWMNRGGSAAYSEAVKSLKEE